MARLLNLDTSSTSGTLGFADEDSIPSWARGAVAAVSRANIMNGSGSNGKLYFNPQATMTRAEVMTVIGRCLPRGYAAVSLELYGRVRNSIVGDRAGQDLRFRRCHRRLLGWYHPTERQYHPR